MLSPEDRENQQKVIAYVTESSAKGAVDPVTAGLIISMVQKHGYVPENVLKIVEQSNQRSIMAMPIVELVERAESFIGGVIHSIRNRSK